MHLPAELEKNLIAQVAQLLSALNYLQLGSLKETSHSPELGLTL